MLDTRYQESLRKILFSARLVLLALVMGAMAAVLVILAALGGRQAAGGTGLLISTLAGLVALGSIVGSIVVPGIVVRSQSRVLVNNALQQQGHRRSAARGTAPAIESLIEPERLWQLYLAGLIIKAAPLEGAAFLAAIAYALEGQLWTIALAAALIAGIAARFPTWGGALAWGERQLEAMDRFAREQSL